MARGEPELVFPDLLFGALPFALGSTAVAFGASLLPGNPAGLLAIGFGLLPAWVGLAISGAFTPLVRRIEAHGGDPETAAGGAGTVHVAAILAAVLLVVAWTERRPHLALGVLPFVGLGWWGVELVRRQLRPRPPTGFDTFPPLEPEVAAERPVAGERAAVEAPPRRWRIGGPVRAVAPAAAARPVAAYVAAASWGAGVAITGAAQPGHATPWVLAGAALALFVGGPALARAAGMPWRHATGVACYGLLPLPAWLTVADLGAPALPMALGLLLPHARLAAAAYSRIRERRASRFRSSP